MHCIVNHGRHFGRQATYLRHRQLLCRRSDGDNARYRIVTTLEVEAYDDRRVHQIYKKQLARARFDLPYAEAIMRMLGRVRKPSDISR
jgi:hypothetical protein